MKWQIYSKTMNLCNGFYEFFLNIAIFLQNFNGLEPIRLGPNQYACPCCSKIFKDSRNCRRHILIHTGEKPFKCPYCTEYSSIQKVALQTHIKRQHSFLDI
jgi:uncharacterized Zn-finger protein